MCWTCVGNVCWKYKYVGNNVAGQRCWYNGKPLCCRKCVSEILSNRYGWKYRVGNIELEIWSRKYKIGNNVGDSKAAANWHLSPKSVWRLVHWFNFN